MRYQNASSQIVTVYDVDGSARRIPPGCEGELDAARAEVYVRAGVLVALGTRADSDTPVSSTTRHDGSDEPAPPKRTRRRRKKATVTDGE